MFHLSKRLGVLAKAR